MLPAEFLRGLWGNSLHDRARIAVWRLSDKRSTLLRSHAGAAGLGGQTDVYTAVALTHAVAPTGARRPAAADARAIAGLWLDIDINGGPDGKIGAAPDLDRALAVAHTVCPPTVVVHTGHGIHAWHLFDGGPWVFRDVADQALAARAAQGWVALHRKTAGYALDGVGDLARLMRLPGTINGKGGVAAPVTVIETGPRHDREQLVSRAAGHAPAGLPSASAPVAVDVTASELGDRLAILLDEDEDFAATFTHDRRLPSGDDSLSAYDLSLATQLAASDGWTDGQIAAVLAAHRKHHGDTTGKAQRRSYLRLTIGNARAAAERRRAHDAAANLALTPRREAA